MVKWFLKKSKSKNTKKLTRVHWVWGILTFFVPSQFSTCLKFLKIFGTSYGLDIVWIGSLHLGGGQNIYGKIQIQKYKKINKGAKNVRIRHILCTLQILYLFEVLKFFWDLIWLGHYSNRLITHRRWWNNFWKNPNPKSLKN